jgi:hypothetical protein
MTQFGLRFIRLKTEILDELTNLDRLCHELAQFEQAETAFPSMRLRALASILHDFYTGCERIFEHIAQEFDGGLPNNPAWHIQLLRDMTLELPTVRPAVINQDIANLLMEYLSFRHRFRNIYGHELEMAKMESLLHKLPEIKELLQVQVLDFIKKLEEVLLT